MCFDGLLHTGEIDEPSAPGESCVDGFSDTGSTPVASTKKIAGRTPEKTVTVFLYGVVLTIKIASRL